MRLGGRLARQMGKKETWRRCAGKGGRECDHGSREKRGKCEPPDDVGPWHRSLFLFLVTLVGLILCINNVQQR